jgi:putative tryptophan/tyrosine transport system substrate-binding protein
VIWPLAARAQPPERIRRIGALMPFDGSDPEGRLRFSAFTQALADLGWTDGQKIRMEVRWPGIDIGRMRASAQELIGLQPDVILTNGTPATVALQRETRTIPIVFGGLADPITGGVVARLDRPGGNITGFALFEASMGGKWIELLSEIAPGLKRAVILFNPDTAPMSIFKSSFEMAARSLNVVLIETPVHSELEIETAITTLGREPGGGLVVMPDLFTIAHRLPLISAVARNNVPAVYAFSYFVREGGLLSYGVEQVDLFRRAASYVDRILKGEKPADLPVQLPAKFEMAINLKTAKALGLAVPLALQAAAAEVIE